MPKLLHNTHYHLPRVKNHPHIHKQAIFLVHYCIIKGFNLNSQSLEWLTIESLKESGLVNPKLSSNKPTYCSVGFFLSIGK